MGRMPINELLFEITEEAEGGYSTECLTESTALIIGRHKKYVLPPPLLSLPVRL